MSVFDSVLTQVVTALRRIRRQPANALMPVLVIACGIATFSAIFAVVELVIFRPLPFPEAERLVAVYAVAPDSRRDLAAEATWDRLEISWTAWKRLQENESFESVGAWSRRRPVWGYPAEAVVETWFASTSLLSLLGARPEIGRLFVAAEDEEEASDAVVLSYECWQHRYGGNSNVVGTSVTLTLFVGEPQVKTIIGVLSPGVKLRGEPPEFLLPIGQLRPGAIANQNGAVYVIGKLTTSASADVVQRVVETVVPATTMSSHLLSARVVPLRDDILGKSAPPVWLLTTTSVILLLVGCASVGGLLTAELHARRHEVALSAALGATPGQILRGLVIDQVLRTLIAAAVGLTLAVVAIRAVIAVAPPEILGSVGARLDVSLWSAGFSAIVVAAFIFGVCPAFVFSRPSSRTALEIAPSRSTDRALRVQRSIAGAQLALTFVLVICATLLGETLGRLTSRPLGFEPADVVTVSIKTTEFPRVVPVAGQWPLFASWTHTEELLDALRRIPGVRSVAGVGSVPFGSPLQTIPVRVSSPPDSVEASVQSQVVTAEYFRTMQIPLLAGRGFESADRQMRADQQEVKVIVSEALADVVGEPAVGRRFAAVGMQFTFEIVGVVGDVKHRELDDADIATIYFLQATYSSVTTLIVRVGHFDNNTTATIVRTIREFDRSILITRTLTMPARVAQSVAGQQFRASLSTLFGGAALLLAAIGVYGLALRTVSHRRREIGIRLALGATPGSVVRLLLRDIGGIFLIALAIGLGLSLLMGRLLRTFLYGVSPTAPHVFIIGSAVLAVAILLAISSPMRRAIRVDPAIVLRS